MTYEGRVEKGAVVLDRPIDLPDGSLVRVEAVPTAEEIKSLREGLRRFVGVIKDGPEDMAENHDFYAHGKPKKSSLMSRLREVQFGGPEDLASNHDYYVTED